MHVYNVQPTINKLENVFKYLGILRQPADTSFSPPLLKFGNEKNIINKQIIH